LAGSSDHAWLQNCLQWSADLWLLLTGLLAIAAFAVVVSLTVLGFLREITSKKNGLEWTGQYTPGLPAVIIVHGTWGRSSTWFRGPDLFTDVDELMGRPVNKARFFWSGGNNMDARFKAAARLAADLTKCLETDRAALFTFVAHSHGGNVVTLASKLLADASRVALVGVSTPFLFYRRREIKKGISIFLAISCLFAVLFGVYGYVKVWSESHYAAMWVSGLGSLTAVALGLRSRRVFKKFELQILAAVGHARGPKHVLAVRAPFDEASALLSTARALVSVMRMVVNACAHLHLRAAAVIRPIPLTWTLGLWVALCVLGIGSASFLSEGIIGGAPLEKGFIAGSAATFLVALASRVLSWVVPMLVMFLLVLFGLPCFFLAAIIVSFAYGPEVFAMCMRLDVGVEASPHGLATIYQIEKASFRKASLDHSAILSDPDARRDTVLQLKRLVDRLTPAPPRPRNHGDAGNIPGLPPIPYP